MKDRIRQYRNSEFLKNSFVTVSGTIAAQAIVLLLQPFLRRMYPAADFGYFSIYSSLAGIPVVIACFRYELAVMLPRSQKEADNIMVGAFIINVFFSVILGILLVLFAKPLLVFLNVDEDFLPWLYAVAPAVFFYANYTLWNGWLVRKKNFASTTWLKLNRRISEGGGQVGLSYFTAVPGLLLGELFGRFVFNIAGIFYIFKNGFSFKYVRLASITRLLKEYVRFPKYSLLPTLLNSAGLLLPAIMFNRLFGKEQTGYFDLCIQTLGVPVMFIVNSLSVVINERLSSSYRNREVVLDRILRIFKNLTLFGLLYFIVFVTLSPLLFGFVFGEEYAISGTYAQILAFTFALRLVVFPFAVTFAALDRIKQGSFIQYLHFIFIGLYFFVNTDDEILWLSGYAILEGVISCLYFLLIIKGVKKYEKSLKSV
jgi:O-antigen/teichoic acid export membrane protein